MLCAIYEKVSATHEGHREVFGIVQVAHDVQLTCTELRERMIKARDLSVVPGVWHA